MARRISRTVKPLGGRWTLGPHHELRYQSEDLNEEFNIKGSLIAAEPEALVFAVTERQEDQNIVTSIHKLAGTWRANAKNQLVFEVEKESGRNDVLTFKGEWEIGKRNQIVYTYEQTDLKTKKKINRELVFQGYWELSEKNRLTYLFAGDSSSAFRFRGAFQTASILAKKGEIRYQIGAEVRGRHKLKTLALFGKWKFSRSLGLLFEIEGSERKNTLIFGGEFRLREDETITVNLKSQTGKPLGVELVFTKDFFGGDGQAFIRLAKSVDESRIEAGVNIKW